ncbi:MAG: hypothetical protein EPN94_02835 [Nitrospirae bacterium]|nr:MAG: hypothetical protein EPN94_02835 [Nitrospirota bacterium]
MALRITIDIFSGRENPVIELTGREAHEAIERLQPVRKLKKGEMGLPPTPTLGYRGLIIEQTDELARGLPKALRLVHGSMFGPRLSHFAADEAFEDFICGSTGPIRKLGLGEKFPIFVKKEIKRFKELRAEWPWEGKIIWPPINPCQCAPLYEPNWWNDGGQRQFNNNCYNYATNYRTDTFAQPGKAAGAMYAALTCASVKPAAVKDELIDSPAADNKCPKEGHLVALVIAPGWDFHWYRKGRNKYWSHKPGGTTVTNLDNSGVTIPDPRTADRGPYTDFCTFMVVMHGHIKIK